jgi:ubiquitin
LTDRIGRELQRRYGYAELDEFLAGFGIDQPEGVTANSKWVYSKAALAKVPESTLLKVAAELEIVADGASIRDPTPPKSWGNTKLFRLFISHISKDKDKATRLRDCLAPYAIAGFVAHIDIHPTLKWQKEIERGLRTMDAMVAIHTKGFSGSNWTQQEVGFALGRGTKVISLMMGELPTGFLLEDQGLARERKSAEDIAKEIDSLLADDPRTKERLAQAKFSLLPGATSYEDDVPF